jgi:ribosomal protein L37AE/L43A
MKLTKAEERQIKKIVDDAYQQLENTVDEMNAYRNHQWYLEPNKEAPTCPECGSSDKVFWCPVGHWLCMKCGWQTEGCDHPKKSSFLSTVRYFYIALAGLFYINLLLLQYFSFFIDFFTSYSR